MKADTIEQFKIIEYLKKNNVDFNYFDIELIDRYNVKITDRKGESILFTYNNGKIEER